MEHEKLKLFGFFSPVILAKASNLLDDLNFMK